MLFNYFKIAFRNVLKYKGFSFINITGLAIGMACCLFIALWVLDELSFDRFNEHADRLYKVVENQYYSEYTYKVEVTPAPLGPALKRDFPDVVDAARFNNLFQMLVRYGDNAFYETGIVCADPAFFTMFTYPFISGDKATALADPNSVVISKEVADKYFHGEDPMGKALTFNNTNDYVVRGVIENVPDNSHLQFQIVVPWSYMESIYWYREDNWGSNSYKTYVMLRENASESEVNEKIRGLIKEHNERSVTELYLQPVPDIHLYSSFYNASGPGDIIFVYIFSMIAMFVLIIACINFMNLSTARSANRAREIGMRKVAGALRSHIVGQFYGESLFMAFCALGLAVILVAALLPQFNTLAGKELSLLKGADIINLIAGLVAVTAFTGITAGSYPALYLSSFKPVNVFRGSLAAGTKSPLFRKILVVVQFSLSIFLIIGTMIVYAQLTYMQNKKLGWEKEQLIYINMRGDVPQKYTALKSELEKNPKILGVTASQFNPTSFGSNSSNFRWEDKDPEQTLVINTNMVDFDFTETMKIDVKDGRAFSPDFAADTSNSIMINEELERIMGGGSAVGKRMWWGDTELMVVGVMKNFHFHSLRAKIAPLVIGIQPRDLNTILIRVSPVDISATMNSIEQTWNDVIPEYPLEYHFFEDRFERMYRAESNAGKLLGYFSALAVFIACLGLFGLASFTAEQRTKEIGIRKVLGASAPNITRLLCIEFLKLVIIANVIAWPVAYYVMNGYLESFAYRTGIGFSLFLITGVIAVIVAMATVMYQAIKAAFMNPAEALKYE